MDNKRRIDTRSELTLNTLFETMKNLQFLEDKSLDNVLEFTKSEITAKTAKKYIDIMCQIQDKVNSLEVNEEQKKFFKAIFSHFISSLASSDCKTLMLSVSNSKNKKYKELINILENELQKERNDNNEIRKKYKEDLKPEKVSIPGLSLSLTTKSDKILTNKECVELMNEMDLEDKELEEKFKRIKVPEEYKNKVERVYVKKNDNSCNQVLQKQKKA